MNFHDNEFRPYLAISGPHGVGKTTLISLVSARLNFHLPPCRVTNPFSHNTFFSMMFYALSFSNRDKEFNRLRLPGIVDRHTIIDLLVEAHVFHYIGAINDQELKYFIQVIIGLVNKNILAQHVILLNDDPGAILHRLRLRPLPCDHIPELETDESYIEILCNSFYEEFKNHTLLKKYDIYDTKLHTQQININGRYVEDIVDELIEILKNLYSI